VPFLEFFDLNSRYGFGALLEFQFENSLKTIPNALSSEPRVYKFLENETRSSFYLFTGPPWGLDAILDFPKRRTHAAGSTTKRKIKRMAG